MTHTHIFLPQPPRLDRHKEGDTLSLLEWMWQFFKALAVDARILIASDQYRDPGAFDPNDIPDPTDDEETTISTAQQTATAAFLLAQSVLNSLRAGTVTVSGASASAAVAFNAAFADAGYRVALTRTGVTGSPAAGSDEPATIAKTAAGFTLTVKAAPGVGTSVSFDYLVIR